MWLSDFVKFAKAQGGAASLALHDIVDAKLAAKKFGVMLLGPDHAVVDFEEKPECPKSSFIGTGIYYFPGLSVRFIQEYLKSEDANDAPGYYVRWLLGKGKIYGYLLKGLWYDIGDLKSLEEAQTLF